MEVETAAVYAGKEVLTEPGDQNRQRAQTGCEKREQENTPVMQNLFQQSVIVLPKVFKGCLEAFLKSDQGIAARHSDAPGFDLLGGQQILRHGANKSPREQVLRQHGKH